MFSPPLIILACCLYTAFLFIIAYWVERRAVAGRNLGDNPVIYALSLTVYLTAWTFYGSVGKAASMGTLFLTFYLGPTLAIITWWILLRKMVRIKNAYRVTSIADFLSLRYNKSTSVAALVTLVALGGIVPYVAVQLKAIISTFHIVTQVPALSTTLDVGLIISLAIILFTIILGVRRVTPTERHQGIVTAIAVSAIVKLVALMTLGAFVTWSMFAGFGDIFRQFSQSPLSRAIAETQTSSSFLVTWMTYLLLSMSAFMFLPRQFHMMVVENFREKHIRTAMWLCPLYMFLISIFVLPVAMAGLLTHHPLSMADTFVLRLPMEAGQAGLSLLVFLGGFAAATAMIIACSMTISTMVTNHLLLPVLELSGSLDFLKRYLLQCRWAVVAAMILAAYWFERAVAVHFTLVDLGMIAFAAVFQFVPAAVGGLFWKRANQTGALLGMGAGSLLWVYTLIVPALARGGFISELFLEKGPWGLGFLRPEHLLGMPGLEPLSHALLWTTFFNVGLFVLGSLCGRQSQEERNLARDLVDIHIASIAPVRTSGQSTVDLQEKKGKLKRLLCQYFPAQKSEECLEWCLVASKIDGKSSISALELAELCSEAERHLAGSIGSAAAHTAIRKSELITPSEEDSLKQAYAHIIAELKVTPSDLKKKIDYHREKEILLTQQAAALEQIVRERDLEIAERKRAEERIRRLADYQSAILNNAAYMVISTTNEGVIASFNPAAERALGYSAEECLGKLCPTAIVDHDEVSARAGTLSAELGTTIEPGFEVLIAKARRNLPNEEEWTYVRKDGSRFPVLLSVTALRSAQEDIIGFLGIASDITERRRAKEQILRLNTELEQRVQERTRELARSLSLIQATLESTAEGILAVDGAGGITCINKRFIEMWRLPGALAVAMDGARLQEALVEQLKKPERFLARETELAAHPQQGDFDTLECKDGRLFERCSLPQRLGERTIGRVWSYRDVSERQQLEDQLRQAQKLEAIGQLAAGIAHEINTPAQYVGDNTRFVQEAFTAIQRAFSSYQELLSALKEMSLAPELVERVEMATSTEDLEYSFAEMPGALRQSLEGIERITHIVRAMKEFSHPGSAQKAAADLNRAIESTVTVASNEWKFVADMKLDLEPTLPPVVCFVGEFNQAVLNLLVNAAHAIGLTAQEHPQTRGAIGVSTRQDGDCVEVRVSDTGPGIPEEIRERIFEPFFTTKRVGQGTGQGLAMVHTAVVKRHGGTLTFETAMGQGTTFILRLPITPPSSMGPQSAP